MGSKNSAPPPPDMSGVANASKEAAELQYKLGQDQLAWAKDQYAANKGTTDKVVDSLLAGQDQTQQQAKEYYQRYKDVYEPAQDRYLQDAENYDTPQRRDQQIGAAQAAVGQNFAAARDAATRQLESFGVDPSSTRYAALDIGSRSAEAAAKAAAGTQSALNTEATGLALRGNAINMGNGLPAQSNASYGTSAGTGTGAVNSGNSTFATGASAMGTPGSYFAGGNSAVGTWGNTLNQGYQNELNQWKANQSASSGWGAALGGIAGLGLGVMGMGTNTIGGKLLGFEEGGAIPMDASPSQGAVTDDVPAQVNGGPEIRVNAGEFVMPRDVTSWLGEKQLQTMIQKARQEKQGAQAKPAIGPAPQQRGPAIPMGAAA
ncbi:hypothetical protein [Bradyrhizobium genosp. SA-3]|uniref:hypothetical protein n=1 Tax=Bradyrhizobium genosp. SA-3 TaxID=508868 RepID=UPI001028C653|nr:hypothetical protein [Bradyrhizobium genosp. SA-3]